MEVIQLKEVTKEFGNKIILDNVSFSIKEGDVFGIIGQSGSGKTTLLNSLIGFYEPDEGEITYQLDGNLKRKPVHKNLNEVKRKFGFAAQVSSFYPKLTIKENLFHFGRLYGVKTKILHRNIKNLLEFTELKDYENKLSEHLSVGMAKRLDLSCSLIHNPKLLLLDEPTANLDPLLQKEILHLIDHANKQGITVVIASHHLHDIEKICNQIVLIKEGKIVAQGTVKEVKKPYRETDKNISLEDVFKKVMKE